MMKSEKGFSLAEVMVAIALLGVVSVAFLSSVSTAYKAVFVADEQVSGESLARSEMEYVKSQGYSSASPVSWSYELPSGTSPTGEFPTWWDEGDPHTLPPGYDSYIVTVTANPLHTPDSGIQKIMVVVSHLEKPQVVSLEGYRSMR
jgi:prepilin-type N-terminal cleavage/methylation domain-containing protein